MGFRQAHIARPAYDGPRLAPVRLSYGGEDGATLGIATCMSWGGTSLDRCPTQGVRHVCMSVDSSSCHRIAERHRLYGDFLSSYPQGLFALGGRLGLRSACRSVLLDASLGLRLCQLPWLMLAQAFGPRAVVHSSVAGRWRYAPCAWCPASGRFLEGACAGVIAMGLALTMG